jgi:hypothetical protein
LPAFFHVVTPPRSSSARTVDEVLFHFLVEFEVAKAQRLHYSVSVVYLALDSLFARVDDSLTSGWAERFVDRIRSTDVIVPYPAPACTLLLVDAQPEALPSIVHRITEEIGPLPWSAGGASYPGTASGAEDLLRRAFDLAARAQADGAHQLYLPA